MGILRDLADRFRFRITHSSKFPKGDLVSFFLNVRNRGFEPQCIVDVGANCGKWTQKVMRVYPDAEYFLIEPQTEMEQHLERICFSTSNVSWLNAGVADQVGEMTFTVVPDTVSSSFTMSKEQAEGSGYEQRVVPVTTLDEIVEERLDLIPDVVKIDAEGFEARIMSGASKLIGKTELFLLEAPLVDPPNSEWSSFGELISMMSTYSYDVYDFTSFQRRPYDGAVGLCEIAFVRRDGQLRSFGGWCEHPAKAA